jgi:hypothetical protein
MVATDEPRAKKPTRSKAGAVRVGAKSRLASSSYRAAATSRGPEAVVKVISHARGLRAKRLMEYVAREDATSKDKEPLELEDERGNKLSGKDEIQQAYKEWEKDFDQGKPGSKRPPRHVTHMTLSADCANEPRNVKKVLAAAREILREQIDAKGYDYKFAVHRDGGKPHVHAIIKNKHREPGGPKLRLNPPELLELRQGFAQKLNALGIEQVATLRRDRPHTVEKIVKGVEKLHEKQSRFQAEMKKASPSIDAFAHRRKVAKSIARMRSDLKKTSKGEEQKRHLQGLRELEKALTKPGANIEKEIGATVNKLGKDAEKFQGYLDEPEKRRTATQRLKGRKSLEEIRRRTERELKAAAKDIRASKGSPEVKKKALQELTKFKKQISKPLGLGLSR